MNNKKYYKKPYIKVKKIRRSYFDLNFNHFDNSGFNENEVILLAQKTYSDVRLKKNITPLTNILSKLGKIKGVSYSWNSNSSANKKHIGIIAQDVEKVFPDLVAFKGLHQYKTVDYGQFIGILIEAVKELKWNNECLKKRIENLEMHH